MPPKTLAQNFSMLPHALSFQRDPSTGLLGWAAASLRAARSITLALACLGTLYPLSSRAQETAANPQLKDRIEALSQPGNRTVDGNAIASHTFLPKLYAALGYDLAWTNPEAVAALSQMIARSWEDGLISSDFHANYVNAAAGGADPASNVIDRDIVLSDALIRLLYQLYFGKVSPNGVDPNWNFARPVAGEDSAQVIASSLKSGQIKDLVDKIRLNHPLYTELKALLQQYTQYDVAGGWPEIAAGPVLKPGQTDPRVPSLRERLRITGEYQGGSVTNPELYDDAIVAAIETFQAASALEPDGVLGPATLSELNVTPAQRVEQIRVNMERARWILRTLGPDMVVVNVAGFYLHVFLKGEKVWTTRVIVGQSYTKTPVFTELMKTVVLNPDWTVPRSIIRNEIFPKAAANPGYLAANNYYLADTSGRRVGNVDYSQWTASTFPYRVVQKPGPRNALGLVKFLFPNSYSVYLHDTPNRQLFAKAGRTFSHGCIRVEDPLKLAEIILSDQLGWERAKIDAAVATGKLQSIALPKPLPVLILYWTIDPSPVGGAFFHRDIYGRDARLLKALNAPFQAPR